MKKKTPFHYIGMEEIRGLYIYESDDADSGEFTYFCMAPDTMATTWHIEFRYGSDLDALKQYDAGEYAYWHRAFLWTVLKTISTTASTYSAPKTFLNNRSNTMFLCMV